MLCVAHICQRVEKSGIAVHRLKVGKVLLLNPNSIAHLVRTLGKSKHEHVLRMRITNGQREGILGNEPVQYDLLTVLPYRSDGQGVRQRQARTIAVANSIIEIFFILLFLIFVF